MNGAFCRYGGPYDPLPGDDLLVRYDLPAGYSGRALWAALATKPLSQPHATVEAGTLGVKKNFFSILDRSPEGNLNEESSWKSSHPSAPRQWQERR